MKHSERIKSIQIDNIAIDDEALTSMAAFENLESLDLIKTGITQKSLPILEELSKRMHVSVQSSDENGNIIFDFSKGAVPIKLPEGYNSLREWQRDVFGPIVDDIYDE